MAEEKRTLISPRSKPSRGDTEIVGAGRDLPLLLAVTFQYFLDRGATTYVSFASR